MKVITVTSFNNTGRFVVTTKDGAKHFETWHSSAEDAAAKAVQNAIFDGRAYVIIACSAVLNHIPKELLKG